ncbi:MAG: peptidylprolyl isomerase [Rhodothermales bacterium]
MAIVLTLVVFHATPQARAQEQVLDEIVAIVGDQILLRSDIDGLVMGLVQQRRAEYSDALWSDALNQLIDQKVMAIHAKRDTTIIVTEDQVDQALNDRINQLTAQLGSTARLEELYGKTLVQIRTELREEFRERILADQLQSRKIRQIKITPSEVEAWFGQFPTDSLPTLPEIVRVSHIVRYPIITEAAKQEALEIVSAIRDSITTGVSTLEDMARRFSEDEGSASQGGRYPETSMGTLVPEFAAVASRIEKGELSAPFKSPYGYHILRVNERRGDVVDFSHVLIKIDESKADPTEAIALLNVLRDSIVTNRVPFELIARRHSEEKSSSEIGGRLTDPSSGERDLFLEALGARWKQVTDTLEIDEISPPAEIELMDGSRAYHIVKLQRRVPSHQVGILTDYSRIEQLAQQAKRTRVMRQWLDTLREEVYIELRGKALELAMARSPGSAGSISQRRN